MLGVGDAATVHVMPGVLSMTPTYICWASPEFNCSHALIGRLSLYSMSFAKHTWEHASDAPTELL